MASPDDLIIEIRARVDQLTQDLQSAQGRIDDFERQNQNAGQGMASSIARARDSINSSMGVVAGAMAVATAAAALLTNQAANAAMEMQRFAAISNMSAEEFQFYAAGANAIGFETEKLGDIFKDVQDKVGDFITTEGGELEDFFANIAPKVGVTAEQFRKLGGKEALQLYVDSLQKAGVSQSEMIFYLESIADDASRLLPLLKDGGKGFEAFGNAAKKAGGLMSAEFMDKAAEMKASMWLLEQSLKGARNQMAEELLPTLRDLIAQFTDVSEGQSAASKTGVIFSGILRVMATIATGAVATFNLLGSSIGGVAAGASRLFEGVNLTDGWVDIYKKVKANKEAAGKILDEGDADIAKKLEYYAESVKKAWGAGTEATKEQLKDLAKLIDEANKISGTGDTGNLGKKAAEEAKKAAEKAKREAEARAKELAAAKQQAQDMLETIRQSAMDEEQVRARQYQLAKAQIDDRYKNELISSKDYHEGLKNLDTAYDNETRNRAQALTASLLASTKDRFAQIEAEYQKRNADIEKLAKLTGMPQGDKDQRLSDSTQIMRNQMAEEFVIRADAAAEELQQRLQQNESVAELVRQAGMTEIEIMQMQHAAKMEALAAMSDQELAMHGITKDQIYQLQADHDASMLDLQMNTGTLMQDMTNSLQQGTLAGNLKFLATSFSAFSGHSKKMFEAQKALALASAAITIPQTVMDSYAAGAKIGGPAVGAVFAATAFAAQIAQLQQIRSATFGGGRSGGGGGGSSSVGGGTTNTESAAPITQRFVNVGLYGSDNTMYSKEAVRELINRIGEEVADGAVLRVT